MKKYLFLVLSLILVFLLVACEEAPASPDLELAPLPVENPRVECDWNLQVDDTISQVVDGVTVRHHLVMDLYKVGGKDDSGVYEGVVHLTSGADMSGLSSENLKVGGSAGGTGTDSAAVVELVSYDVTKYAPRKELAPLIQYDLMAMGEFALVGNGFFNINLAALDGSDIEAGDDQQFQSSASVAYKILVHGGQVSVTIPSLNIPQSFDGMITGKPKR